jgi:hypothetical protein
MAEGILNSIPRDMLRKLDFMLGELSGTETLYPPGKEPVQFDAHVCASREDCERFVKIDFFADIPSIGIESFLALVTYSEKMRCYRLWIFAASQEEPLHMTGDFEGDSLVMVSDPSPMLWGMQRMRSTFTPLLDGGFRYVADLWEPDGYTKYCSTEFKPVV